MNRTEHRELISSCFHFHILHAWTFGKEFKTVIWWICYSSNVRKTCWKLYVAIKERRFPTVMRMNLKKAKIWNFCQISKSIQRRQGAINPFDKFSFFFRDVLIATFKIMLRRNDTQCERRKEKTQRAQTIKNYIPPIIKARLVHEKKEWDSIRTSGRRQ